MRTRPIVLLSTVAAATLLLAGCSGSGSPESTSTPEATTASDCLFDAPSGAGSDAVAVEGEGATASVTVPADTEVTEVERTVIKEGDGEDLHGGDLVSLRYQLIDAATSEVLETSERGPEGILPALLSTGATQQQNVDLTQEFAFTAAVECLPLGSHVVLVVPSSSEDQNPSILYVETIDLLPTVATGEAVAPVEGMPTVELDDDGAPTITIPDADAPAETEVAVLEQGDGATVGAGDLVTVQYRGVKWSDGEEFDSSWGRGAPAQFQTTGVVTGFQKALEGQKVGSQVLVTMTPADGYGAEPSDSNELAGESLVFVVDILGTTPVL
ncbi:FKBP-type peptidyl-prolyl cis-trans isomerase [Microbacterium tumbae]